MKGVNVLSNILIVEDDDPLREIISEFLTSHGHVVSKCQHANEAYERMYHRHYDLIISDIMMPEIDGFELAKTVRQLNKQIPILFMTARDDFSAKKQGFHAGIDDYMVKPLHLEELLLRVSALLRRANIASEGHLTIGDLVLNQQALTATLNEQEIPVTLREFHLLYKLLSYPNQTFSRAQLMDDFWGIDSQTSLRAVDVYMTKLRDKFSTTTAFNIVTVYGLGYKAVLS